MQVVFPGCSGDGTSGVLAQSVPSKLSSDLTVTDLTRDLDEEQGASS